VAINESEVKNAIKEFLVGTFFLDLSTTPIEDDTSFLDNGIIDSTGILEVINFIQETYEIEVEDDEMLPENLDSLQNIAAYINRKKN